MTVRIHDDADQELEDTFDYYQYQRSGLGQEFLDEYARAIQSVVQSPDRWPFDEGLPRDVNVHRFLIARFPYAIVYQIRAGDILVLGVMHLRRRPGYWHKRLP